MNLSFLRRLYATPGPWASLYLDASHDTEDARQATDLRLRAAQAELRDAGADEDTLSAMESAARGEPLHTGRYGLAVFGAAGRAHHVEVLAEPPPHEFTEYGPLPHVMPMLAQRGERVPWLRVVVDRTGADIVGATTGGTAVAETVKGSNTFPIRKVQPGGWSQQRYQNSAELTWDRNAAEVAEAVTDLAAELGAEILVVAGDVHARPLLVDRLPKRWQARVVGTEAGSRAAGADPQPLDDATAAAVAAKAREHVADVIDRFQGQLGRDEAAGAGLPAVVTALQRGQVDTMILVNDPTSTDKLWIGPGPLDLSFDPAELRALGVDEPVQVRADAALVRALAGADADLIVVEPGELTIEGGVGALLRYADAGTRHR